MLKVKYGLLCLDAPGLVGQSHHAVNGTEIRD